MYSSVKSGLSFGITSGIITTLGLMIGLNAGTHSEQVVLGGILTIALADAFSDALGIHISQESENEHTAKEIWLSTVATFVSKLTFALSFALPVLLLSLDLAIMVGVAWGVLLLTLLSSNIAQKEKMPAWRVTAEHLIIALFVIIFSYYIGDWINRRFS